MGSRTIGECALFATLLFGGCATSGLGGGQLLSRTYTSASGATEAHDLGPVQFKWHSDGGSTVHGRIEASLPDGRVFRGTYLEPTDEVRTYDTTWGLGYYGGYGPWRGMGPWGYGGWYGGPSMSYATHYSGLVVASLGADDGTRMQCRFQLAEPSSGMAGGALGECQLTNGQSIASAGFPASSR